MRTYDAETIKMVEEVYQDIDREAREEEGRYRSDLSYTLAALIRAVSYANESGEKPLPLPVRALEVLEVKIDHGLRTSGFFLRARCEREDGVVDVIEVQSATDNGDRECPPDHDEVVQWETIGDDGNPIEYMHFYTICREGQKVDPARERKVEWLYKVLRRQGFRCRMHGRILQVPDNKYEQAHAAIGRYITRLKEYDPIFSTDISGAW